MDLAEFLLAGRSIKTSTYIYIISRRSITPRHIKHNSMSLDVVQSLYFGSKLPSSGMYKYKKFGYLVSLYLYVPDEGSLLPKYRDCTTSKDFELYIIYIYILHIY